MKKLIYILAAVVAFASCSDKFEELEYRIDHIEPSGLTVVLMGVDPDEWVYTRDERGDYFRAKFDIPEITGDMFDNGLVKVYRTFDYLSQKPVQLELPQTRPVEIRFEDGSRYFYTEVIDYEIQIGAVIVYYTVNDFDYEVDQSFVPDALQFRCVLIR